MNAEERTTDRRLRVLMVSQRLLPYVAGAEVKLLDLARSFLAAGATVQIVTTRYRRGLARKETLQGVRVRRLGVLRAPRSRVFARLFDPVVKLSQLLSMAFYVAARGRRFDLVHANCVSASSLGAIIGARLCGRMVINEPSFVGSDGELNKLKGSIASRLLIRLLKLADRFAANSQETADELIGLGIAPERIVAVKNGVDLEVFYPADETDKTGSRLKLGLPPGRMVIFVGQLIERKGVSELLEAWREVVSEVADANLIFAGDGLLSEEVQREAARPGSRVIQLGVRDDVAELMRAADALVLPSRNESFGNVLVEAMASGLPVVTCRTGLALQMVVDGVAGRVVDGQMPADIACALCEVLSSPALRANFGQKGRVVAQQYDIRQVAREYLSIYNSMVDERRDEQERNGIEDRKRLHQSKHQ